MCAGLMTCKKVKTKLPSTARAKIKLQVTHHSVVNPFFKCRTIILLNSFLQLLHVFSVSQAHNICAHQFFQLCSDSWQIEAAERAKERETKKILLACHCKYVKRRRRRKFFFRLVLVFFVCQDNDDSTDFSASSFISRVARWKVAVRLNTLKLIGYGLRQKLF